MGISPVKRVILCADDYAQSPAISAGILSLVAMGRLSAVSCMSDSPHWRAYARQLPGSAQSVDVGVHFNLTHGPDAWPLRQLMRASLFGSLPLSSLQNRLERQLDLFEDTLGRAPDFLDGHQHVHIFPGLRQLIIDTLIRRYPSPARPYLRRVAPHLRGHDALAKAVILRALGLGYARKVRQAGLHLSGEFAGLYSLREGADFPALLRSWLRRTDAGGLIMCHPGFAASDPADPIAATRALEYRYLASAEFGEFLNGQELVLGPFVRPGRSPPS
jgi:predicted glycoside hydrolase/deacetylase ChbG (UPF0249 family)